MSCIFDDSFLYSSRFLSLSLHLLTSLEIPIHLFGVYLIYTKTPKTMNSAKNSIMQLHIACSLMDLYITFFLVLYFWIPISGGIPVGFLTYLGVPSAVQIYIFYNIEAAVALTYVAFFENRYDVVVIGQIGRSSSRNTKRMVYFGVNAFLCVADLAYAFSKLPEAEWTKELLRKNYPCIPESLVNDPMYFNLNMGGDPIFPYLISGLVVFVFVQGSYFVIYTTYHLFFTVRNVSTVTQQLQKKFFIAMTLQAFVPLIAFAGPMFYWQFAWRLDYLNQMYNNLAMIALGFNGLLTTIVMTIVHAPYRKAVSEMIGRGGEAMRNSRLFTKIPSRVIN